MPPSYWYELVFTLFSIIFSGVLVNLHHSQASNGNTGECGLINIDAIQQVVAAKWAVDVINNQSLPHELRIGRSKYTIKSKLVIKFVKTFVEKNSLKNSSKKFVINNQSLPHELRIGRSTSNSKSIFSHVLPRYCQTRPLDFCTQCVIWTRIIFLEKCDSF